MANERQRTDCLGCAHAQRRFRRSQARTWCLRYHKITDLRCVDYRSKPSAIKIALDYLKRSSIK